MTRASNSQSGFTITEVLIVLVVLGLIAAAVSPAILGRFDNAKVRAANLQLETLSASLDAFLVDVGRYPTLEEGLGALLTPPAAAPGWAGPYVRSERSLTDPWGEIVHYGQSDDGLPYVASFGADKTEGGEGSSADLRLPETAA